MSNEPSALAGFRPRTSWQAIVVILGGFALFGSQWLMPTTELFAHVKMKVNSKSSPLAPYIGREVPDMEWIDLDGRSVRLSEFRGKRVVLNIFATWCGPCKAEIPTFNQFAQSVRPDAIVVGLSVEDPKKVRAFLESTEVDYGIVVAKEILEPLTVVDSVPTTLIISPDGVLEKAQSGMLSTDDLQLLYEQACQLNLKRPTEKKQSVAEEEVRS
jgi:peroxiredoxin